MRNEAWCRSSSSRSRSRCPGGVVTRYRARGTAIEIADLELVSISGDGNQANNDNDAASISADGRYVAFVSLADNLVPNDTNLSSDVFVRDREADTTERVSVGPLGVEGDGNSGMLSLLGRADISRDGRFVAFASEASNFVLGDVPGTADVFVHDRRTRTTELISRGVDGLPAGGSTAPSISGDGRFVAFRSFSDRLCPTATRTSSTMSSWSIG